MRKITSLSFLLLLVCLSPTICRSQTTMSSVNHHDAAPPDGALRQPYLFVRNLLNDPLFSKYYRESHTVFAEVQLPDSVSYDLVPKESNAWWSNDSIHVGMSESQGPGQFHFSVFLVNSDARETEEKIDWEAKEKQWDAFVARNWPDVPLVRETDWKNALPNYNAGRGIMRILYSYRVEDINVYSIGLNIRISDGLIGGLGGGGYGAVLKKRQVTPAPTRAAVAEAVLKQYEIERTKTLRDYKITGYERRPAEDFSKEKQKMEPLPGFMIRLEVQGRNQEGLLERVRAQYIEESKKVEIKSGKVIDELDDNAQPAKPLTFIADGVPFWSADGKDIFFATTREVKDRPFWSRGAVTSVKSIARYRVDKPTAPLELVRLPQLKTVNEPDLDGYSLGVPSPSGKYLALTTDGAPARLFVLDLKSGAVYNPRKDWSRDPELAAYFPPSSREERMSLVINGCAWLPDETGLLISLYRDRDVNLYLATWQPNTPPEFLHLNPVLIDEGDDILPCFSSDGKRLAWISQSESKGTQTGTAGAESWKFVVGDYDGDKAKISSQQKMQAVVTNKLSADLPSKPQSVSWDNRNQRWLVAGEGYLQWIQKENESLKVEKLTSLLWQQKQLKPVAATISPQGRVAVTAQLPSEAALLDEENLSVVTQLIFDWDGKSKDVKPLYEPGQNNLMRYIFVGK